MQDNPAVDRPVDSARTSFLDESVQNRKKHHGLLYVSERTDSIFQYASDK